LLVRSIVFKNCPREVKSNNRTRPSTYLIGTGREELQPPSYDYFHMQIDYLSHGTRLIAADLHFVLIDMICGHDYYFLTDY